MVLGQVFHLEDNEVEVGQTLVVKNLFFNFSSCELLEESHAAADSIALFLKANEGVVMEIGGHWDNKRPESYSEMSQRFTKCRAQSLADYLVSKGIRGKRLTAVGYELKKPLFTDDYIETLASSEEQELAHDRNRRIELTIIEKK